MNASKRSASHTGRAFEDRFGSSANAPILCGLAQSWKGRAQKTWYPNRTLATHRPGGHFAGRSHARAGIASEAPPLRSVEHAAGRRHTNRHRRIGLNRVPKSVENAPWWVAVARRGLVVVDITPALVEHADIA